MSFLKIFTGINWLLIGTYGAFMVYWLLTNVNPYNDAGGQEMEIALKGLGVFLLLVLIGLNYLPYSWTKIIALILVILLLLLLRYITTH